MEDYKKIIRDLLADPEKLRTKKPFTRGSDRSTMPLSASKCDIAGTITASLPKYRFNTIPQEQFLRELDPNCHDVLFDENIPSICVKLKDGGYYDIKYKKTPVAFQERIRDKKKLHLTGNKMQFTLVGKEPTDDMLNNFATFKEYWEERNMDGMRTKMVDAQLSYGDAGLLFYYDYKGRIKARLLSFVDGYVLCPHNDENGDRILESVYYQKDGVEYIDSYDDEYMYRWTNDGTVVNMNGGDGENIANGWRWHEPIKHGFPEIPLITKRGDVAWNNVQTQIESYEILYNVFHTIQKRFGWGVFYVRGKFMNEGKKIAGSVVLNDTSLDGKGDAKFLEPPSPKGMIETLDLMEENIQKDASCTFILPKDISMSGDITGIAVMLTQAMDIEEAKRGVIEWQNVASKMCRLFKHGLSVELVNTGVNPLAVTQFKELRVNATFKVWRPVNDTEYNNMLISLKGSGLLSQQSGVELNTESKPDELRRLSLEEVRKLEAELAKTQRTKEIELKYTSNQSTTIEEE